MIFQRFNLLMQRTCLQNVCFPMEANGVKQKEAKAKAKELLTSVGISEEQHQRYPANLSGGEQQRVAIARALSSGAGIILADEPTGNLDPAISLGIMKLLERINRTGTTVIVATHDREMVDSMHRRVIALEGGHVIRDQERGGYGNYGTN